jgi:exopolyphosphatase / guanosine-5'-triphosphate,3'-diphosphate pyrophosphatase
MLLGVLDIGSNSAQLQVVEARPGVPPLPTHAVKEPILLGQAFGPDGCIDDAGVERVVLAVARAMDAARRLGVEQLYVFTTSAVRDAANRDVILDRVETEAGVRPQFLSGHDEARLTYLAVHQWYGWSAGRRGPLAAHCFLIYPERSVVPGSAAMLAPRGDCACPCPLRCLPPRFGGSRLP